MKMFSLTDFIRESNRIEGIIREPVPVEILAHEELLSCDRVTVGVLKQFVYRVANAELRDKVGMDVRVGNHFPPRGGNFIRKIESFVFGNSIRELS